MSALAYNALHHQICISVVLSETKVTLEKATVNITWHFKDNSLFLCVCLCVVPVLDFLFADLVCFKRLATFRTSQSFDL